VRLLGWKRPRAAQRRREGGDEGVEGVPGAEVEWGEGGGEGPEGVP